ncbi:hypothetical protein CYY_000950 [Polysphondylium violaceum]|uniref:RabGAP/TBC domain-containing protein n=1 Tax=Polysphondylium violaceum TaxID=133409 RepID=A0A8J4PYY1_9MYCE|nr:hypothetical protein CYY_000950 [Polysphondylium violaceum]
MLKLFMNEKEDKVKKKEIRRSDDSEIGKSSNENNNNNKTITRSRSRTMESPIHPTLDISSSPSPVTMNHSDGGGKATMIPTRTNSPPIPINKNNSTSYNDKSSSTLASPASTSSKPSKPLLGGSFTFGAISSNSNNSSSSSSKPIIAKSPLLGASLSSGTLESSSSTSTTSTTTTNTSTTTGSSVPKSPLLFSPTSNINSLSPSLFASPGGSGMMGSPSMSPLGNRVMEGYMNGFYEQDKDPGTIERDRDELVAWSNILIPKSQEQARKEFKFLIRRGVPDELRHKVWWTILGGNQALLDLEEGVSPDLLSYQESYNNTFSTDGKGSKKIRNIPSFGGVVSPSDHYLTEDGVHLVKTILKMVSINFPEIDYCPLIPDIVHILLLFMSESNAYLLLSLLIKMSNDPYYKYLNTSNRECTKFILTFDSLIEKNIPKVYKHMISLGFSGSKQLTEDWFSRLFISVLPFHTVLRIFDIYLNEGYKVFYRVGLALIYIHKKSLLKATTQEQFLNTPINDSDDLIKKAFSFHLKRKDLDRFDQQQHSKLQHVSEPNAPIYYKPKVSTPSEILNLEDYEFIWAWLPHSLCICDPKLVFNSNSHGFNLRLLYEKCGNRSPVIVIIKSDNGSVFGFFTDEPITPKDGFGSSQTFVFTLRPNVNIYKPTGNNDLFSVIKSTSMSIGISSLGDIAISIDKDLKGTSAPTDTFGNPNLNNNVDSFQCNILEAFVLE